MNRIADMAIATLNADERAKIAEEQSNLPQELLLVVL